MINEDRPYALTIGGHDPSGGAGVTADLKTMESIGVQGMSVCSSLTFQTEDHFEGLVWMSKKEIKKQLKPIIEQYNFSVVKIGIIENLQVLKWIAQSIKTYQPNIIIIWDPVIKTSSGFKLHDKLSHRFLISVLKYIDIITPNWNEMIELIGEKDVLTAAEKLSETTMVYLKGGHNDMNIGTDYLFVKGSETVFVPEYVSSQQKHGSGCIFSSALASYLALSYSLDSACVASKRYITEYLDSSETLLGIHFQSL
ncbi:MAG TPA: hydroxymethylpyrimidine/phosphomethylpyrimidine kinase [Chitinophagales bacterium]|nr:hydroxymethylpyrimidine/phosphomethylpyrimidine kinase [Chitinophagales bacterium]